MSYQLTDEFILNLNSFSGNKIKNPADLKFLLNAAQKQDKITELDNISFTAKYINGLKRVLLTGRGNPEISNIDQIEKDLSMNFEKLTEAVKKLLEGEEAAGVSNFSAKYLQLDQQSFTNLNTLIDDLEWTKMYLNKLKRD